MKRFHVHVSVDDLDANVRFYSTVFGMPPTILKPDYAKWMVDDPRVNFAISRRGGTIGIDHLGVQVDSDTELSGLRERVAAAEIQALDQPSPIVAMPVLISIGPPTRRALPGRLFIRSIPFRYTAMQAGRSKPIAVP